MKKRILIVEDVALVAMDLEAQALDAGWDVVGPASSVSQALDLLSLGPVDAALLDVQVGEQLVTPVAEALAANGVPMVFASGYKAHAILPEAMRQSPALDKPYSFRDVELALANPCGRQSKPVAV